MKKSQKSVDKTNIRMGGGKLTNPKNKKMLLMGLVSLFTIAIISLGTYAIWNSELLTGDSSITTGQIKMSYTETNEITMDNALPMKDEEGKVLTNYFDFQVLSYIKTKDSDSTKRKINYNIVLEPLAVENALSDSEIKVYLTMIENGVETVVVEPTTIDQISNYILNNHEDIFSNNKGEIVTSYRLRSWIDESVDTSKFNDKKYSYKFRVNINSGNSSGLELEKSEANAPLLTSNMIPVYYDDTSRQWKKADVNNAKEANKWYDYDNKMWANAVTVYENNRETYLKADAGTTIPMSDINTMWVWIPRYTYTYLNTNTPQEIKIKFESGTNSSGTIKCVDAINQKDSNGNTISETCTDTKNRRLKAGTSTYTHPAFWWDKNDNNVREEGEELTGIWVGKFEVSNGGSICTVSNWASVGSGCNLKSIRPRILPNIRPWQGAQSGTFFNGIYNMRESGNQYGFSETDETHMMKNMEWGAVAYLSHSKYGINKEIAINSENTFIIGCGPQSEGSTESGSKCNSYTTTLGQSASTTGNIYGVYDMSGGASEIMMSYTVWSDGQLMSGNRTLYNQNSAFTGILYDDGKGTPFTGTYEFPSKRYYDKYSYGTSHTEYTRGKLGDATKEMAPTGATDNWYKNTTVFPYDVAPIFDRGGYYSSRARAGAFYLSHTYDGANIHSTRAVISNLN